MSLIRKIILKIGREAAVYIAKKSAYFPEKYKVISFTFDDFLCTAKENGARILEANKVYGTFYVSLGLAGQERNIGRIGTQQEMLELSQSGHELGCHTFSHLNCAYKTDNLIYKDCLKNQEAAMNLNKITFCSFAYPFGSFDPLSKKVISKIYNSARTIEPGINVDTIDMAALKSVSLSENVEWKIIFKWLEKVDDLGGWLIFNIHDVSDIPSQFGCTIKLFEKTIEACLKKGFQIMTVREATNLVS